MSDGLRKSVSGVEDLVSIVELPGPESGAVSGTCGIPTRSEVCGLRGDLDGSAASPCCVCVSAASGVGGVRSTSSESLLLGISCEVLESSREIRDCVGSVFKERAC